MPVVIFTGMPTALQVDEAYRMGANSFLEKPHEFAEMVNLVASLYATWSTCLRPSM
jgi:DNA-binding NtrC family response regulator